MHGSFPVLAQIHVDGSNNIYTGSNLFMSGYANLRTLIFGFDHSRVRKFAYPTNCCLRGGEICVPFNLLVQLKSHCLCLP